MWYNAVMSTIFTLSAKSLQELSVRQGDTLRILSSEGDQFVIELHRVSPPSTDKSSSIRTWLQTAKGSVQLGPGETVDQLRQEFYSQKYELEH